MVAPYVGAWIETRLFASSGGLEMSHPTWVRGLKHFKLFQITLLYQVAPYVGAWIETQVLKNKNRKIWSHPTWVRGLKLHGCSEVEALRGRTLRGCVD